MKNEKSSSAQQPNFSMNMEEQESLKSSPMQLTSEEITCLSKGGKDAELIARKFELRPSETSVIQNIVANNTKSTPQENLPRNIREVVSGNEMVNTLKQQPQFSFEDFKDVEVTSDTKKRRSQKKN
jgi:hypothetical protein